MPDFYTANVKQNLRDATSRCFGRDDCGWTAVMDGQALLTGALAPVWFCGGVAANEMRLDVSLVGARIGDQVRFELWAQQQDKPGGGILVWSGTLTITAGVGVSADATWFALGAARGPQADAWGVLARYVTGDPDRIRARLRLSGSCLGGTLGTVVRGENVAA